MELLFLSEALENLKAHHRSLAAADPGTADKIILHLLAEIERLQDHPQLGEPGRVVGTRELHVTRTPFVVPYRVHAGSVEILRVLHARERHTAVAK